MGMFFLRGGGGGDPSYLPPFVGGLARSLNYTHRNSVFKEGLALLNF